MLRRNLMWINPYCSRSPSPVSRGKEEKIWCIIYCIANRHPTHLWFPSFPKKPHWTDLGFLDNTVWCPDETSLNWSWHHGEKLEFNCHRKWITRARPRKQEDTKMQFQITQMLASKVEKKQPSLSVKYYTPFVCIWMELNGIY